MVFAKAPRLGRVKSRLARDVGPVTAWAFYRQCVATTTHRLGSDRRWTSWLAVTPDRERGAVYWPRGWRIIGQGRGDLGRRMAKPLYELPPGPLVLVGTDIPDLGAKQVAEAFRLLGDHDAVFGPATDGGFWLVGIRRSPRTPGCLYDHVRWSSPHALADTLKNLAGLKVALLAPLSDVDEGAAYYCWLKSRRISDR
ncbi:conserved protein of unknown function [Magnetospira sp. QH-2]|nr:conserved protein of unknown function [Magnetospira sp. QH-2]